MKLSSGTVVRRTPRVLPAELLAVMLLLLAISAPAPVPAVRAVGAQALVAVTEASAAAGLVVSHHVLAVLPTPGSAAVYQKVDAPLPGLVRYQVLRVRFRLHNTGEVPVTVTPLLQYRAKGASSGFVRVREGAAPGEALHTRREWVRSPSGVGTVLGPGSVGLDPKDFLMSDGGAEVVGHRSSGPNPDRSVTLPGGGATEQEFTLGVRAAAEYLTTYELRLTDAGTALGSDLATISLGAAPVAALSPGQRQGVATAEPSAAQPDGAVRYPLSLQPKTFAPQATMATAVGSEIHGPYSATTDLCSMCHRTHTARGSGLLAGPLPQATLCFTCHDGTGASHDVNSEYAGAPANNPADRAYYTHDALTSSSHTLAEDNEFGGVLDRHNECGDCHNPHQASGVDGTQTSAGWTASGRLSGVSGVAVTNGAAGTAPTYSFLDGTSTPITLEYQLCLKCHSGSTVLPSNSGFAPSRQVLDKGIELNPNNGSFHPVEAAGTNATAKMAASLSGTSPYKLWNLSVTSTIRCTQCHATGTARTSPPPAEGANLPPHTSANRGVLLANYRDRVLSTSSQTYAAADFALCLLCHAEKPFATESATGTNFFYHGKHLTRLRLMGGGGTDIDSPGAGQGNAICSECHFRIHSPVTELSTQSLTGSRLVSFAPNVSGRGGVGTQPAWAKIGPTTGSCALTCHGFTHEDESY